jgi:hypothetical protein
MRGLWQGGAWIAADRPAPRVDRESAEVAQRLALPLTVLSLGRRSSSYRLFAPASWAFFCELHCIGCFAAMLARKLVVRSGPSR